MRVRVLESVRMRRRPRTTLVAALLAAIALGTLASVAAAGSQRSSVDTFIFGEVTGRVPGKNASRVDVRWDFKCLGDKLGEATYEWTLVASTIGGATARTVTLRTGTTKSGRLTTVLTPGRWQLRAEPFLCETDRGAGSTAPEVGQVVDVPDRCAWLVTRARGSVEVDAGSVVRRARPGASLTPASAVTTPAGAAVDLKTAGGEASLAVRAGSRLVVDRATCGGNPRVTVTAGCGPGRGARSPRGQRRRRALDRPCRDLDRPDSRRQDDDRRCQGSGHRPGPNRRCGRREGRTADRRRGQGRSDGALTTRRPWGALDRTGAIASSASSRSEPCSSGSGSRSRSASRRRAPRPSRRRRRRGPRPRSRRPRRHHGLPRSCV